jgi:putative salt-induced outer membrane protein YdiY
MTSRPAFLFCLLTLALPHATDAQTPSAPAPPPIWDVQLGASFVGTGGNTHTSTVGADLSGHRRWDVWRIETTATAVRTTDAGVKTAERYLGGVRGDRTITERESLSMGEHLERDRLAGMDFRSIMDAGIKSALVKQPAWTVDGLTSLAWTHESPILGPTRNDAVGVLQALSKYAFSKTADTTQRFTFYPDLSQSSASRAEAELTAQAAMNSRLALKIGYLWRYSNAPTEGFVKTDNTATASVVLRWKAT